MYVFYSALLAAGLLLPLVTAQATLATAENNQVESLYAYNVSKIGLARASGVLEQQYRSYLGQ